MAASSGGGDDELIGSINVTPLVDIMLVLVIILMVTAEFTKYRTVNVALPKMEAAAMKTEPKKVNVTVKALEEGAGYEVYINDKKIEQVETIVPSLKAMKVAQPEMVVILRAEGATDYKQIITVLDQVKLAGIAKVGLAVDFEKPKN